MGRAEGDVIKDEENEYFKMVRVQWWVHVKKRWNLDEWHLYEDYWNGKWKCNLVDLEQWLDILAILFSFPIRKNTTNKSQINIPTIYAPRAKINFNAANASTNLWRMLVTLIIFEIFWCLLYHYMYWINVLNLFCNFFVVWFNKNIILQKNTMYMILEE